MNDNEERPSPSSSGAPAAARAAGADGVHVLLIAPDDDAAVRTALQALTGEGYAEAELDQIGDMEGHARRGAACLGLPGRAGGRSVDRGG